ncbi:demethylmenaquinone methyltransferase/2-methoxy-6-polyprenyl-1,4-benzoquinol methylase [Actinoalloteichus hoggarensis]|uniref:Demethylmenaquinone methyltransferase n=1 Tax=Actinoalloteichus hoggarensis TaxID=1470176 RepID=A0A221VXD4_9PSEU|nr:demethylmenaquinone methyltransferase [Actinoalloteichus hoggarensis]ASO18163.1 Ubiquinone/menaquinone biosynthesis C-methyltransferase UbiE [Actinoalloteichus hoggarensis]MBB5921519.1 demethylmenaquinone methyltransferase/2-methoxy-6-polyprenyl-1,4-benzoquinol methylase [Actinoalloteichus hoggarensis]
MVRAGLDKNPREVADMFDGVAEHYDRTNTVLTAGMDRYWRRVTLGALAPTPGERILDLAAGTGVSTVEIGRSGAFCVAADFSLGMLRRGRDRKVPMVAADGLALPFADGAFDGLTIMFALRNFADTEGALREMHRVVRPGGRLVICEFSTPPSPLLRELYFKGVLTALPKVANLVASNPVAYSYLSESIRAWPDQEGLARLIGDAGWERVAWRDLTFGAVAVHRATRSA